MKLRPFGEIGGSPVLEATIRSDAGLEARVISWGAILRDLIVPERTGPRHVVLGFESLADYRSSVGNFGAIVGRSANRIAAARFRLDGAEVQLVPNENGNTLHGGPTGFARRLWSILGGDERSVHLALVSEDGDGGYPGRLFATCSYEFSDNRTLRITLQAVSDRPTPANLTTHTYYNLDGSPDVREHLLSIAADQITPTDPDLIPTGAIAPVAGTPYDFRSIRPIRADGYPGGYDINFVLKREIAAQPSLAEAAILASARSGLRMELWTTEPGLQVYDGRRIDAAPLSHGGLALRPFSGLALEPQRFPDGPNHAYFPPCILRPGEVSRQISELRFSEAE